MNANELQWQLGARDFADHLEEILEKHPDLANDPNAKQLMVNHALEKARREVATHGRLVTSARNYAKEAFSETKKYLKREEAAPREAPREAKREAVSSQDTDNEEMSNEEYANFFRNMGNQARRTPAISRSGHGEGGE
jgi:hypothetical protein